jgi:hypothetical protein
MPDDKIQIIKRLDALELDDDEQGEDLVISCVEEDTIWVNASLAFNLGSRNGLFFGRV